MILPTWIEKAWLTQQAFIINQANAKERQEAWQNFLKIGLPNKKLEQWKYFDSSTLLKNEFISAIHPLSFSENSNLKNYLNTLPKESLVIVFRNGFFVKELSKLNHELINITSINANSKNTRQNRTNSWYQLLNDAFYTDGIFIDVPDNTQCELPIYCVYYQEKCQDQFLNQKHIIKLGKNARAFIIEEYLGTENNAYWANHQTEIVLDTQAILHHAKYQAEGKQAHHFAHTEVQLNQGSEFNTVLLSKGAITARDDINIDLNGQGAFVKTLGYSLAKQKSQYIDQHLTITHQAHHTESEMFYKNIIHENAKTVFNGRLCVNEKITDVKAYQGNYNVLMSSCAEAYSKPELEIYSDQINCKHGAAIGQLDEDAFFYLRSRGISEPEAMKMLLLGFRNEVAAKISAACIQDYFNNKAEE